MSAKNLLLYPLQWKDADNNTPPAVWDGTDYHLIYNGSGNNPTITFTGTVADGDFLEFDATAVAYGYASIINVIVNGSIVQTINAWSADGATQHVKVDPLSASDTVQIQFDEATYDTYQCEVKMTPTGTVVVPSTATNLLLDPTNFVDNWERSPTYGWNQYLGVYENCGNNADEGNNEDTPNYSYLMGSANTDGDWIAFQAVNRFGNPGTVKVTIAGTVVFNQELAQNDIVSFTSDPMSKDDSIKLEFIPKDATKAPDLVLAPIAPSDGPVQPDFITGPNGLKYNFVDNSVYAGGADDATSTFAWSFGQNPQSLSMDAGSSGKTVAFTYDQVGTYIVVFCVTWHDSEGNTGRAVTLKKITVTDTDGGSSDVTAKFEAEGTNLSVAFTDQSTVIAGKTITAWEWDFGDSTAKSHDQNPTHIYANPGAYTVTLTVTDSDGKKTVLSDNISVTAPVLEGSDTYSLKAFMAYGSMADNAKDEIAKLGELSVYSETYATDRLIFSGTTGGEVQTTVNCSVFSSIDTNGQHKDVPVDYSAILVAMGAWVYTQATSGQFTNDADAFSQQLTAEFGSVIHEVKVGAMVQQGTYWLPENLTFHFTQASNTSPDYTSQSRVKVWFSDQAFRNQYDDYLIEIVPPLTPMDDFYKSMTNVDSELKARTIPELMDTVRQLADKAPYTVLRSIDFTWHDPNVEGNTLNTTWTFLIYGQAGNNIDAIKAQLVEYILTRSEHTRDEWAAVFPDIFTSTEFIITPMWDQYAVPNKTLIEGVYSPTVNDTRARSVAKATAVGPGYTQDYLDTYLNYSTVPYKSLAFLAIGGADNRGDIHQFLEQWPDYMTVSTTSLDFDRMQPKTQQWLDLFYKLLKVAEEMTDTTDIPVGMTRLHRTNDNGIPVLYVSATFDNVQYLVVAKSWLITNSDSIPDAPPSSIGGGANTGAGGDDGNGTSPAPLTVGIPDGTGNYFDSSTPLTVMQGVPTPFLATGGTLPYTYKILEFGSDRAGDAMDTVKNKGCLLYGKDDASSGYDEICRLLLEASEAYPDIYSGDSAITIDGTDQVTLANLVPLPPEFYPMYGLLSYPTNNHPSVTYTVTIQATDSAGATAQCTYQFTPLVPV